MTKNIKIPETDALIQYDNRLFFTQTLAIGQKTGEITPERIDEIHEDTALLSHKLITIKAEDFASSTAVREHIQEAFALTSIGLEYGSKGDLEKSVLLLNKNRTVKFFQIGNTLVDGLVARSRRALEASILTGPEQPMPLDTALKEIHVFNGWEREFLESISGRKLVIDAAQVVLDQVSMPRPITNLEEIAVANRQLDNFDLRLSYFQALPQDKVFETELLYWISDDLPRQITRALMGNLILYREIDFQLTPEDWDTFRDIAYDPEVFAVKKEMRGKLLAWIGHYLKSLGQPEEVQKYAVKYWEYCLDQLETEFSPSDAW